MWDKEPPTLPGWYWLQYRDCSAIPVRIAIDPSGAMSEVWFGNHKLDLANLDTRSAKWQPLSLPS